MNRFHIFALASLLTCAALPAKADDQALRADIRCTIVGVLMVDKGGQAGSLGMLASLYFLGKVDGRVPDADLEKLMTEEILKMNPALVESEAKRCGAELSERGKNLKTIGGDIQDRLSDLQKPKT